MLKAIDIAREPGTALPGTRFRKIAGYEEHGVFSGSFSGKSHWERHLNGEEFLQVLSGEVVVTVRTDGGLRSMEMRQGMIAVVPRAQWHRVEAKGEAALMTITPLETERSESETPWISS